MSLDLPRCMDDLRKLVAEIEQLEEIEDDTAYKEAAERYVRQYLPPGREGERFSVPEQYFIDEINKKSKPPVFDLNGRDWKREAVIKQIGEK
ncbi:hypothetical protein PO124_02710 [Bacillus licheniformis]|nr:hypothetical protein [Bacillus licheniformis]